LYILGVRACVDPNTLRPYRTIHGKMQIPTIRLLDNSNLESLIQDLRHACTNFGFFYLEDHGVPLDLIERVRLQCKELFYLPLDQKQRLSDKTMARGYTAFEEETLDPYRQVKGDTKEGYYLGEDIPIDSPRYNPAKLMGPNQWPDPERCPSMRDCQEFQNVMNEYRMECKRWISFGSATGLGHWSQR
jgi:isopenicillin N synthase-like dioxygenase